MRIGYRLPTRDDSPLSPQERFDELFKAARVLLQENAKESQIIPTLALANEMGQGRPHLLAEKERLVEIGEDKQAWDDEAHKFARRYGGLRPVRIEQEILILEKLPILVAVDYAMVGKTPEEIVVSVYPHRELAKASDVTTHYEKALSEVGVDYGEQHTGILGFSFYGRTLEIRVQPGRIVERLGKPQPGWRVDKALFPDPRFVGGFYKMLLDKTGGGFRRELAIRTSGPRPDADNLVPACVAFLLLKYGIKARMERHGMLSNYVLGDTWKSHVPHWQKTQFRSIGDGGPLLDQLWRDAGKDPIVGGPLKDAAWTLFWEGYDS